jgi:soluble lytic murein transglycosylase-like protein
LLTKRTYSAVALLMIAAFPVAAIAAPSSGSAPRIGVPRIAAGRAVPVEKAGTGGAFPMAPGRSLRHAIHVTLRKTRAARRARLRREHREAFARLPGGVSRSTLNAIAACESGGNPRAISAGGTYRGKYQFDYGTWESVGGHGDPAAASEAEQDYRAALLYSRAGSSPWPVCG